MQDYVSLFLDSELALGTPEAFFSIIILGLARLLPIIGMSPFFGARIMTNPAKVAYGLSMVAIMLPTMLANIKAPLSFNMMLLLYASKELFIGFSIGWIMSTPFSIVSGAGSIIDHQRGGASLMVNDPSMQAQSSPLGTLFNLILIYLFFFVDGHVYFIEAINTSYQIIPPDQILSSQFFRKDLPFWKIQISLLNEVMKMIVQLGAPALICILMTDMFLGIANRLAPQVQITFLGMALKSFLALMMVWIGWKAYNDQTIILIFHWLDVVKTSIFSLKL